MKIKLLTDHAHVPTRAHPWDAGADLYTQGDYQNLLYAGATLTIPLGISIEIPEGWVGLVCPRSGLASKYGVTVLNSPGVIDPGFTGQVKVVLHNTSDKVFEIGPHMRIAQLLLQDVQVPLWEIVSDLAVTERGMAGFGSTGA